MLQSDLFGSLNDSGLLSRASEALMAVDVKHPVVSCSGENFIQNFRPTFNSKQNFFYILLHYYYYYYFSLSQYNTLLYKLFKKRVYFTTTPCLNDIPSKFKRRELKWLSKQLKFVLLPQNVLTLVQTIKRNLVQKFKRGQGMKPSIRKIESFDLVKTTTFTFDQLTKLSI